MSGVAATERKRGDFFEYEVLLYAKIKQRLPDTLRSMQVLKVLFIGDIVGSSGVKYIKEVLPELKAELGIDLIIANAENAAGGLGLTTSLARSLHECGVKVMTLGNHTWSKWDVVDLMDLDKFVCRPANGHPNWPGEGYSIVTVNGMTLAVINLLGQYALDAPISPFIMIKDLLARLRDEYPDIKFIVDMHAEATAEKLAMAEFLDGEAAAILGTHTHVQTADERISEQGTAYITDVGMTGPREGIIGMSKRSSLRRFVCQLPARYEVADGPCMLNAVVFELDDQGRAVSIDRIQMTE